MQTSLILTVGNAGSFIYFTFHWSYTDVWYAQYGVTS